MRATQGAGTLTQLDKCYIEIPSYTQSGESKKIYMNILPEISDSKNANYPEESAIGRSTPFKTYQNSETRTIGWTAHFFATNKNELNQMANNLRMIESLTYPITNTSGIPFSPPQIVKLRCGDLLSKTGSPDVCAVLKSYSVNFDVNVPWDEETYMPYKLSITMQFDAVYDQAKLPGAQQIMVDGIGIIQNSPSPI